MCVRQAFLDVPDGWRVAFCYFLALPILLLLVGLLEELLIADAGEIKNLEGSGKIIVFLFLLLFIGALRSSVSIIQVPVGYAEQLLFTSPSSSSDSSKFSSPVN